jgi:hypothetical protein
MISKWRLSAAALFIAALSSACGGKSRAIAPDGRAGFGGNTSGVAGAFGAGGATPPGLAANGVPIPPPALAKDSCALLAVQSVACSPNGACQPVTCDCGGNPLVFNACYADLCVAGISCPAACAAGSNALTSAFNCFDDPVCSSDADCNQPLWFKCLVPPNAASGACVTGAPGSPCLADADCQSPGVLCVVTAEGLGHCENVGIDRPCNTDKQCSIGGGRCALAPDAFAGVCTAGGEDSLCFTQHDCQPSLECVLLSSGGSHVCTSRRTGAPCTSDPDCGSLLFCLNSTCRYGGPGDSCTVDSDCRGFCGVDCHGFCGAQGTCSDGRLGSPCRRDHTGCVAGLVCSSGTCRPGGPCQVDTDCPTGLSCVESACSDGFTCGNSNACQVGFLCNSNSTCSQGRFGDACGVDSDCRDQGFCDANFHCSSGAAGTPCRFDGTGCVAGVDCIKDPFYGPICGGPAFEDAGAD